MRSHTQSVAIEPNRRIITGCISYKPLISDLSVLRFCNKTGGTIKRRYKKMVFTSFTEVFRNILPNRPLAESNFK